jgi:hypothetical protein
MTPQEFHFNASFQTPGGSLDHGIMEEPSSSSSATSMKRPRPESYQNYIPKIETKKMIPTAQQEMPHFGFPTNSFIEQFDSTHIDEYTQMQPNAPMQPNLTEQIPTPPPTRDTAASARRKANRMRQVLPMHLSVAEAPPRRMSVPDEAWQKQADQSNPMIQTGGYNFDNLQLAMPEMYDFDLGPLTAPAYPQGSVFWDPGASVDFGQSTMPMLTQGHVPAQQMTPAPFVFQAAPEARSSRVEHDGFVVPSLPAHASRPQTSHSSRSNESAASRARASTMQSQHLRKVSSVDPSALFTAGAPGALPMAAPGLMRSNSVISNKSVDLVQPYQYQTEALRREREARTRISETVSRSGSIDLSIDTAPTSAAMDRKASMSRSRHGASMSRSAHPSSVDLGASMSASMSEQGHHIPRNPSPLKQQRSNTSQKSEKPAAVKPSGKQPVVLRIDSQGRAITMAKPAVVKPEPKLRVKVSFNDNGDSESDSDDEDLPTGGARSRASTLVTGLTRSRSLRTSPTRSHALNRSRSLRTSPNKNEAQQALHEAVKDRRQKSIDVGRAFQVALPVGADPFTSAPSFAMPPPPPPQQQQRQQQQHHQQFLPGRQDSGVWNIPSSAPLDPNMHTPPEEFAKQFLESTRCVCNNMLPNDGQLMVQW